MTILWQDTTFDIASSANPGGAWRCCDIQQPVDSGYQDYGNGQTWDVNPAQVLGGAKRSLISHPAGGGVTLGAMRTPAAWAGDIAKANGGVAPPTCGSILITNTNVRTFGYGYFEFDTTIDNPGRGMFPSNWMYAARGLNDAQNKGGGEIDLFECFGYQAGMPWNSTIHTKLNGGKIDSPIGDFLLGNQVPRTVAGRHLYGLDWTVDHIRMYFDDALIGEADAAHVAWFQGMRMDLRLNYTMDATWFAAANKSDTSTPSPLTMTVHSVTVYDTKPTGTTMPLTQAQIDALTAAGSKVDADVVQLTADRAAEKALVGALVADSPTPPPPPPPPPPAGNGFSTTPDAGYKVIFADDYLTPVALGGFRSSGYMATHDAYDDESFSTDKLGRYSCAKVVSVSNSCLDYYLHSVNGQAYAAAVVPGKYPGFGPYAIVEFRMRADAATLAGFKQAILTFPPSNVRGEGENDIAEGSYGSATSGLWWFLHGLGTNAPTNLEAVALPVAATDWHTYRNVTTPQGVSEYVDGKLIKAHNTPWSTAAHRLVLQTETWYSPRPPAASAGHVQFDWVKIQVPA